MDKLFAISTVTAIVVAGLTASPAAAKHRKHHSNHQMSRQISPGQGGTVGMGGNAALSGNNGNSAQGSNSLGHIKGGDIGGGK